MDIKFVEAGQGDDDAALNWGKFMLGRYSYEELTEPTRFPGCEGGRLVSLRGNGYHHLWIFDLATGEAIRLFPDRFMFQKLNEHRVWVCPLFEPFVRWLGEHVHTHPEDWWTNLPRHVLLPKAPFEMFGYRRGDDKQVELETRVFDAESALAELVRLQEGPRDESYDWDKDLAWERAKAVLAQHDETPAGLGE